MQNQLNGSGGRRQAMSSLDFYRRVPKDLTEVCNSYSDLSSASAAALLLLQLLLLSVVFVVCVRSAELFVRTFAAR